MNYHIKIQSSYTIIIMSQSIVITMIYSSNIIITNPSIIDLKDKLDSMEFHL